MNLKKIFDSQKIVDRMGEQISINRSDEEKVKALLNTWTNGTFTISERKISVQGDVLIKRVSTSKIFGALDYEFDTINGNFTVEYSEITSMQGFPRTVNGDFSIKYCYKNIPDSNIEKYCPDKVGGYVKIRHTTHVDKEHFAMWCECDIKKISKS